MIYIIEAKASIQTMAKRWNQIYDYLYDSRPEGEHWYSNLVQLGDDLVKNETAKPVVKQFIDYFQEYFTSDREVAALALYFILYEEPIFKKIFSGYDDVGEFVNEMKDMFKGKFRPKKRKQVIYNMVMFDGEEMSENILANNDQFVEWQKQNKPKKDEIAKEFNRYFYDTVYDDSMNVKEYNTTGVKAKYVVMHSDGFTKDVYYLEPRSDESNEA